MNPIEEIAARLRQARELQGVTVAEWAERIGDKPQRVTDVENRKQRPPTDMISAVVSKAGVSPTWLFMGIEPAFFTSTVDDKLNALQRATVEVDSMAVSAEDKLLARDVVAAVYMRDAALLTSACERARGSAPTVGALDAELLQAVVDASLVEISRQGKHMVPGKLGELLVSVYDSSLASRKVNPTTVSRLIRLAS